MKPQQVVRALDKVTNGEAIITSGGIDLEEVQARTLGSRLYPNLFFAGEVLDLLTRLNAELGKTVVMVTHDPRAGRRARKVQYLDKGVLSDAPEDPSA